MRSDVSSKGAGLVLEEVCKDFGDVSAVTSIDLDVPPGEFLVLLGPSGSGKTTTLNLIAGFLWPRQGRILLNGRDVSTVPPHRRNIGMVFQNYALFPHMSVADNVGYPLKHRKVGKRERAERIDKALELVELSQLGHRRPSQLSGGQQQRVALARALIYEPPLLLMDEPLGALDKRLRESLQLEIKRLHQALKITFIYVTHDQDEALMLSDRIAIFRDGRVEQIGTAEQLYERPRSPFVAEFLGDSNLLRGRLEGDGRTVALADGSTVLIEGCEPDGIDDVCILVRPERLSLLAAPTHGYNTVEGVINAIHYMGSARRIEVESSIHPQLWLWEPTEQGAANQPGDRVLVGWRPTDAVAIPSPFDAVPMAGPGAARRVTGSVD